MRILFLSTRAARPSFRFRVEQMLPAFQQRGCECVVEFLPDRLAARLKLFRRAAEFDAVFLQKRLLGPLERGVLRHCARRLIFDLDDAVMYDGRGQRNGRRERRFRAIVQCADLVVCGNEILADEAIRCGCRPVVIPTAIDATLFHPGRRSATEETGLITLGWTGSRSTTPYLARLLPILAKLGPGVQLKVIADQIDSLDPQLLAPVPLIFVPWSPQTEVTAAATFDIGLMPLPDDPWTRGKCGFKALQYMALGVPAVCSPVGANREILAHGRAGFLPADDEEWGQVLRRLIGNRQLREQVGREGRSRIEAVYDVAVQAPRLVDAVYETCETTRRAA